MSLTKIDLQAIQGIVETVVTAKVQPMIDDAVEAKIRPMIDALSEDTAAGFAEVHEKFAGVSTKFDEVHSNIAAVHDDLSARIEQADDKQNVKEAMLHNTAERVDALELVARKLKTA